MILNDFKYYKPKSNEELFTVLNDLKDQYKFLAGGTDLIPGLKDGIITPEAIVDLKALGLNQIVRDKDGLEIGATVTLADLIKNEAVAEQYRAIWDAATNMATPAVRERATIGGNLCNASPSADTAPPLIVYGAKVVLQKNDDIREIELEDFFVGPGKSCLNNGELLTSVLLPPSAEHSGAAYVKHARTSKDLALLGVAVYLEMEGKVCRNCRIALGAVGATPLRVKKAEEMLEGKELSPEIIETAVKEAAAEARPIDDQRASAEYRRDMVLEITRRAIQAALARIV